MMRSINIPVSYYTGTASIDIPVSTVAAREVQIPVTLSYQASGWCAEICLMKMDTAN